MAGRQSIWMLMGTSSPVIDCPQCQSPSSVLDTRKRDDNTITRRRQCTVCQHRWSTREISNDEWRSVLKARRGYAKGGKRGGKKSVSIRRGFSVPPRLKEEYNQLRRNMGVHAKDAAMAVGILKKETKGDDSD